MEACPSLAPIPVPLTWVPQGRGFRASRIVACLGTWGPSMEGAHEDEENGGATLNRGGEEGLGGPIGVTSQKEISLLDLPCASGTSTSTGAGVLMIVRGMRTYCAGEVVRFGTVR